MKIILTKENIQTVIKTLDFYSRIWIGQYDNISWDLRFLADVKDDEWPEFNNKEKFRDFALLRVRRLILPDLAGYDFSASHGIWNFSENDPRAIDAYDLQQCIRHANAWHLHPEGGWTRDFDDPWIRGRYPEAKTEISGNQDDYRASVEMVPEQYQILVDSAKVYLHMIRGELREMFDHYTDNEAALILAEEAEKHNVSVRPDVIEKYENYLKCIEKEGTD